MAVIKTGEDQAFYCDSSSKSDVKQEAWNQLFSGDRGLLALYTGGCFDKLSNFIKNILHNLQHNQSEGTELCLFHCSLKFSAS